MSLSIPFPSIQWRSVRDLCALNNAVLKGQEGDEERVNALVSRARRGGGEGGRGGRLEPRLGEKLPLISRSVPIMKCIR